MAVLTGVDASDARKLLEGYGLTDLESIEGIPAGSVNSNFSLKAGGRRLFLRVYEEQALAGARREGGMLERLAAAGVETPSPLRRKDGELVSVVHEKPAALFPWREGAMRCQASVSGLDVEQIGRALARVHLAGAAEPCVAGRFRYEDLLGRLRSIEERNDPRFGAVQRSLREALDGAHAARDTGLPGGLVHGDLFRDNVLWRPDGTLSALLDFESACAGTFAYDLMVCVLSWCVGSDLDAGLASLLRAGYEAVRPLSEREKRGLFAEGTFAALRFTITRITDYALRTEATGPRVVKDWQRFWMRYERLRALGDAGLRHDLGV